MAIGLCLICSIGVIKNFQSNMYIYSEIIFFLVVPILLSKEKSIKFMVNIQFIFVLIIATIGLISTTYTLSQFQSVSHMKSVSETWMWPFIISGGLNGLMYTYGLLLPIYVFLLNSRYNKKIIFILFLIPFILLNLVSGWHGKGIIVAYALSIIYLVKIKFPFIFWLLFFGGIFASVILDINYDSLYYLITQNARFAEYIVLYSLDNPEVISVESLFIRLYSLYGIPAVLYGLVFVIFALFIGLRKYKVSLNENNEGWLVVFFLITFFALTFVSSNLFLFYIPSIFLGWSFYLYIIKFSYNKRFIEY